MPDVTTVGDLLDYLATQPRDRKVVMSKDAEGNGYSPLADAGEGMYLAETTWAGMVYVTPEQLAVLKTQGGGWSDEDAAPDDAERVVVLGPVNLDTHRYAASSSPSSLPFPVPGSSSSGSGQMHSFTGATGSLHRAQIRANRVS